MWVFFTLFLFVLNLSAIDSDSLFRDLSLVGEIDKRHADSLPFIYNFSMMGGYFNMPSGRMPKEGVVGFGAAHAHPENIYGLSFQYFDRIELSANYRVYTGLLAEPKRFKDNEPRLVNIKFAINLPEDGLPDFPTFALGADSFIENGRFNSQYIVMTKQWIDANIEATLGWGRKKIKGFFGGLAWTPLRKTSLFFFKDLTFLAEYDATRKNIKNCINSGVSYVLGETLQLSLSSLEGQYLAFSGSLRYPLGTSEGFIAKVDNPSPYRSPIDTEPLGVIRLKHQFAQELAYALGTQGLDLYRAYLTDDHSLWIKIVNNRYRKEGEVRERLQRVLAAVTPSDITLITVVIEANGVSCQSYKFRTEDLYRYRERIIGDFEMKTLSPLKEAIFKPDHAEVLFRRKKDIWTFTFRPRLITFFGSAKGKIKYNVGVIATPEGYLFDDIYYVLQAGYQIKSSMPDIKQVDHVNPSQLPHVRTDTIRYFQTNTLSLEVAYLQKGWSLGKGWYSRLAGGYFEPAYGGGSIEFLYYPVNSTWAIGVEEATVFKRRYRGFGFTNKIERLKGVTPYEEHFIGVQYFLDFYYTLKPWDVDLKIMVGQFLAKDRGARFEISRWFPSGLEVSLWYTLTNGHDHVNGRIYHDKGFSFALPLDFFLKQSSRTYIGYAMSAWLRDVGAVAMTGRQLYNTLRVERK